MEKKKLVKTVFVMNDMDTKGGLFSQRIDVGFVPKEVIVKHVIYDSDDDLVVVKAPFVQGGIVAAFADSGTFICDIRHKISSMGAIGSYDFRLTNSKNELRTNLGGELVICLEFHG